MQAGDLKMAGLTGMRARKAFLFVAGHYTPLGAHFPGMYGR
jgi:hypothetical protein